MYVMENLSTGFVSYHGAFVADKLFISTRLDGALKITIVSHVYLEQLFKYIIYFMQSLPEIIELKKILQHLPFED